MCLTYSLTFELHFENVHREGANESMFKLHLRKVCFKPLCSPWAKICTECRVNHALLYHENYNVQQAQKLILQIF